MRSRFFLKHLLVTLIPLLAPLLIFGSLSIALIQNNLKNNINSNTVSLLNYTKETIELVLNENDRLSIVYDSNPDIGFEMDAILQHEYTTYDRNQVSKIIKGFMNADPSARPYIHSIYVYYDSAPNNFFSSSDGVVNVERATDRSWYESYRKQDSSRPFWAETRTISRHSTDKEPLKVITVYHRMISRKGVIVLNILPRYIENILNNVTFMPNQNLLIMSEDNEVIFRNTREPLDGKIDLDVISRNPSEFFTAKFGNESYLVSQLQSARYGWKYFSIIPLRTLYAFPAQMGRFIGLLLIGAFVVGLVLALYATRISYRRIQYIMHILELAESGRPLPLMPKVTDEYSYIVSNILKTFIESSYLKIALSEKRFRLRAMELTALQSQMNPHFLFNTLKTIYWKSYGLTSSSNEVSDMIENLSDILHYSLSDPKAFVTLEEEIRATRSYADIQMVRYRDKFDIQWEIAEEAMRCVVMKLFMQPIIENSIYHGIKEKAGKGRIKVKAFVAGRHVNIAIVDNGVGMDRATLDQVRNTLAEGKEETEHIGLYNTDKRLKLIYGETYGLTVRSKRGFGTAVYLKIPLSASGA